MLDKHLHTSLMYEFPQQNNILYGDAIWLDLNCIEIYNITWTDNKRGIGLLDPVLDFLSQTLSSVYMVAGFLKHQTKQ